LDNGGNKSDAKEGGNTKWIDFSGKFLDFSGFSFFFAISIQSIRKIV